jgi:hypothetical protein
MNHRRFPSATQPRYCPECAKLGNPIPSPLSCPHGTYKDYMERRRPRLLPRILYMDAAEFFRCLRSWLGL